MNLIPPEVIISETAVAVTPVPTNVRVCVFPRIVEIPSSDCPGVPEPDPEIPPIKTSSISETPVSITSSSYLKSSHFS